MCPHTRRLAFSLLELLVVLGILGVLVGLLLSAVQRARGAAARQACSNNLRQLGIALHSYADTRGTLPQGCSHESGRSPFPFASWCARLLPFLEQEPQWDAIR